jgi:predicted small secreted protein
LKAALGRDTIDTTHDPELPMIRLTLPLLALLMLAACETVKGAGRDLQSAGAAISTEAAEAQSSM